jgi:hypothetical protein
MCLSFGLVGEAQRRTEWLAGARLLGDETNDAPIDAQPPLPVVELHEVLEDERRPRLAARLDKRAAFGELAQPHGADIPSVAGGGNVL